MKQFRAQSGRIERLADQAEARDDKAAECKAREQLVALAKTKLREIKPDCYHIPALAGAGQAELEILEDLRDMTCDPDYDWGEDR